MCVSLSISLSLSFKKHYYQNWSWSIAALSHLVSATKDLLQEFQLAIIVPREKLHDVAMPCGLMSCQVGLTESTSSQEIVQRPPAEVMRTQCSWRHAVAWIHLLGTVILLCAEVDFLLLLDIPQITGLSSSA